MLVRAHPLGLPPLQALSGPLRVDRRSVQCRVSPLDIPGVVLKTITGGLQQLTDVSNSYKRGALKLFEDQAAADRDVEWVSVTFGILILFLLADISLRIVAGVLKAKEAEDTSWLPDKGADRDGDKGLKGGEGDLPCDAAAEVPEATAMQAVEPAEIRRMEQALMRDQVGAEQEATLVFLAAAWFIFQSGSNAFLRTPNLPLQP
jgi:hypothetical protein